MNPETDTAVSPVDAVAQILEGYAQRGVFRGFSRGPERKGKTTFKMMWHHDRMFEFVFDANKDSMRFPVVLPEVPSDSEMYKRFKAFLKSRQSEEKVEHRRIDKRKADVRPYNRGGNISLTLTVKDGDYAYGARKLVHFVHEIYLDFLYDGNHYDYMIETFDLDPDHP